MVSTLAPQLPNSNTLSTQPSGTTSRTSMAILLLRKASLWYLPRAAARPLSVPLGYSCAALSTTYRPMTLRPPTAHALPTLFSSSALTRWLACLPTLSRVLLRLLLRQHLKRRRPPLAPAQNLRAHRPSPRFQALQCLRFPTLSSASVSVLNLRRPSSSSHRQRQAPHLSLLCRHRRLRSAATPPSTPLS